jgi:hypothetical protein
MDVNWYAAETMIQETLHARRAKAETARLAATARQYRTRRGIGAAPIKLGRARVGVGIGLRRVGGWLRIAHAR